MGVRVGGREVVWVVIKGENGRTVTTARGCWWNFLSVAKSRRCSRCRCRRR